MFEGFKGSQKTDSLLHGHSFTAYPAGCWAAGQALDMYKTHPNYDAASNAFPNLWDDALLSKISFLPRVEGVVSMGSMFAVTLKAEKLGYASMAASEVTKALRGRGVFARPLGSTVYLMASPTSAPEDCTAQLNILLELLA